MTANDGYRTPLDAQLRYTVQWFHEWSEMQRGDFLPILAQKLAPGSYVNGVLSFENLSCNEGRPPSLFQCRVKLFREWFETWSQADRDQFLGHIKSMDPGFYSKMQEELNSLGSDSPSKGGSTAVDSDISPSAVADDDDDDDETKTIDSNPPSVSVTSSLTEDVSPVAVNGD